MARQALSMVQTLFAQDNFWCATPLHVLGTVLMQAGQPHESEDCYRHALGIYKQKASKAYAAMAELKIQLSESLLAQNRLGEAEQITVEARDDLRRHLGDQDPLVKSATKNLIAIYEKEGKNDLAKRLAHE